MTQRPRDTDDDPTSAEEALEFDGTTTQPLDDTYRLRVVTASESDSGTVAFDDRGQPRWQWISELGGGTDLTGTFDQLKALENSALRRDGDQSQPTSLEPERKQPCSKAGYDPYARHRR